MNTENLIYALQNVIETRNAHDEAFKAYGGYSWGWAGSGLIDAAREAESKFASELNAVIDARVREILKEQQQ